MLQRHNIRVWILDELSHDLQLAVFEPLVLQDFFDCHHLVRFHDLCLEDDPETSVSDNPFRRVANIFRLLLLLLLLWLLRGLAVRWGGRPPHGRVRSPGRGCRCCRGGR